MIFKTIKSTIVTFITSDNKEHVINFSGNPSIGKICNTIEKEYCRGSYIIKEQSTVSKKWAISDEDFVKYGKEVN